MRAILVGHARDRERWRGDLDTRAIEIVGEFETLFDAHTSGLVADVMISAAPAAPRTVIAASGMLEEPLTPREIQVLQLLAEGLPNKGIAGRLDISDQTVKFHVSSIMGKLGTANRVETVRRAVRRGLLTL